MSDSAIEDPTPGPGVQPGTGSESGPATGGPGEAGPAGGRSRKGLFRGRRWWRLNYLGLVVGLTFTTYALTPSLLPRPWVFQGLIAGIAAAFGYGLGTFVSFLARKIRIKGPRGALRRGFWWVLLIGGPILFAFDVYLGSQAQDEVRSLVGEPEGPGYGIVTLGLVICVVALLLVGIGRGIRAVTRELARLLGLVVPQLLARAVAVVAVTFFLMWLVGNVVGAGLIDLADAVYSAENEGTKAGASQPTVSTRSGSTQSLASWESLGLMGRSFVGRGPTSEQISQFTGEPAKDPIRVYVGVKTVPTAAERATMAVAELERTGGFDRAVLVVAGATGTGWLEPQSVDSIEYMWGGDTAIATIQYSYLPSWMSFLVDQERATDAGRALFDAVYAKWSAMPPASRPKLLTYGLSLGSFAAQAPFKDAADMAARTDGALFMGTPNFSQPWSTIEGTRDAGSPEWQPVYQKGATVRFGSAEGDLAKPGSDWPFPHVVFMQHGSDPVVWWSPNLISGAPDWLREPRAPDVSPDTRWYPLVTFLQVTVDQFFGVTVPPGHGHNYGNTIVYAWQNVLPPPGWTPEQAERLQAMINEMPLE